MYMNFYNMRRAPFHITPDPDFLFLSPSHKEALGAIIYCIEERKGFVSVIGEVGTGKTTILRSYLAKSDRSRVKPIYVFNPYVSFFELLKTIYQELGATPRNESVYDMVQQLNTLLIAEYTKGRHIVLIIDEAQNMASATFEELRILSNLETSKDKLLQIILAGQPELVEKLARKELRQLNQRIAIRATLSPLSPVESRDYIIFRLSQVTPSPNDIFTPGALKKITKAANGSPRRLNILCDNALIAGFGYQSKKITGKIAKQVISDFDGKKSRSPLILRYAFIGAVLLFFTAVIGEIYGTLPPLKSSLVRDERPHRTVVSESPENKKVQAVVLGKDTEKRGAATLVIDKGETGGIQPAVFSATSASAADSEGESHIFAEMPEEDSEDVEKPVAEIILPEDVNLGYGDKESSSPLVFEVTSSMASLPEDEPEKNDNAEIVELPVLLPSEGTFSLKKRTVRKGEYLSQICMEIYGFVNDRIIEAVKEKNPHIFDADLIFIGDTISFPESLHPQRKQTDSQGG